MSSLQEILILVAAAVALSVAGGVAQAKKRKLTSQVLSLTPSYLVIDWKAHDRSPCRRLPVVRDPPSSGRAGNPTLAAKPKALRMKTSSGVECLAAKAARRFPRKVIVEIRPLTDSVPSLPSWYPPVIP